MNAYKTIAQNSQAELVVKKSKFIGRAIGVPDQAAAKLEIEALRKQHWDASHNCYAYAVEGSQGYSDDGEPHGTAGQPILEVINRKGLSNTLVIVTRYFGGVLLGAGGLIRAYTTAAATAIEEAGICNYALCLKLKLSCDYATWPKLQQWLKLQRINLLDAVYTETVDCFIAVEKGEYESFVSDCANALNAKADVEIIEEAFFRITGT